MSLRYTYEKSRFTDRAKELGILGAFIAGSAFFSALLMDLLVYPTSLFAVKNKVLFTYIVKYLSLFLLLLAVAAISIRRYLLLKRDGFGFREIINRTVRRSLRIAGWLFLSLGIAGMLVTLIYYLLSFNYYLLYKLTQI